MGNRVLYGLLSYLAMFLMYWYDVPVLMRLGVGVIGAFGIVSFFAITDRSVWDIIWLDVIARSVEKTRQKFDALKTKAEKMLFLETKEGKRLSYARVESPIHFGGQSATNLLIVLGIMITVITIAFPVFNRNAATDKNDRDDKRTSIAVVDQKAQQAIDRVNTKAEADAAAKRAEADADIFTKKTVIEADIKTAQSRKAQADAAKQWDRSKTESSKIEALSIKLNSITENPKFEVEAQKILSVAQSSADSIQAAADAKGNGIEEKVNSSTFFQKLLNDFLAIISPLLVLFMSFLKKGYAVSQNDHRNTFQIAFGELVRWWKSWKNPAPTINETTKAETIVDNNTPSVSTPKVVIAEKETEREIDPREINAKVKRLGLFLPSFPDTQPTMSNVKNWYDRAQKHAVYGTGTGLNAVKFAEAIALYERELGLIPNWLDAESSQFITATPSFLGSVSTWGAFAKYASRMPQKGILRRLDFAEVV